MRLSSTAFAEGGTLPPRFTCDGDGVSPPLAWEDVPDGTQGFALPYGCGATLCARRGACLGDAPRSTTRAGRAGRTPALGGATQATA